MENNSISPDNQNLNGISGWLALFAIRLGLGVFQGLAGVASIVRGNITTSQGIMILAVVPAIIISFVLLLRKNIRFREAYVVAAVMNIIAMLSQSYGGSVLGIIIGEAIWCAYLYTSKRVRITCGQNADIEEGNDDANNVSIVVEEKPSEELAPAISAIEEKPVVVRKAEATEDPQQIAKPNRNKRIIAALAGSASVLAILLIVCIVLLAQGNRNSPVAIAQPATPQISVSPSPTFAPTATPALTPALTPAATPTPSPFVFRGSRWGVSPESVSYSTECKNEE